MQFGWGRTWGILKALKDALYGQNVEPLAQLEGSHDFYRKGG